MGIFGMNPHGEQNSFVWWITIRLLARYPVSSMKQIYGLAGQWLRNCAEKVMVLPLLKNA